MVEHVLRYVLQQIQPLYTFGVVRNVARTNKMAAVNLKQLLQKFLFTCRRNVEGIWTCWRWKQYCSFNLIDNTVVKTSAQITKSVCRKNSGTSKISLEAIQDLFDEDSTLEQHIPAAEVMIPNWFVMQSWQYWCFSAQRRRQYHGSQFTYSAHTMSQRIS